MEQLDVNPADLLRSANVYAELAGRLDGLSPHARAEAQRVAETHGPMGYPAVVGISAGLDSAEQPLNAKVIDFQEYSRRFTEHAATYVGEDSEAARRYRGAAVDLFDSTYAGSLRQPIASGYIIWCSPATLVTGFICEFMGEDGGITWRHSPIDISGGMP
ncbi:type VII secretion target [Mycobacterium sp.]|uniref:type VII secretion target n=1 Tax=Mycobacterium sp. TaxID=1785 RepID=UPI0025E7226F|nr:type VII secretion target [Mycobacterium sp.]